MLLFSGAATTLSTTRWRFGSGTGIRPCPRPVIFIRARFDAALALVRAGYEDLIALRDKLSPSTHLVFQGYDFAIPDGRGICGLGPWLKPTFDLRKFPTLAAGQAVVKAMLEQFAAMLTTFWPPEGDVYQRAGHPDAADEFVAQRTSSCEGWLRKICGHVPAQLKALFPARVA